MDGHTESEQAELSRLRTIVGYDIRKKNLERSKKKLQQIQPQIDGLEEMLPQKYQYLQIFIFGVIPGFILFGILWYLGLVD